MKTLAAQGLSYAYPGPIEALADVGFDMGPGELVTILGPNGAGKSTLLKLLAGLDRPARSSVALDGTKISDLSAHQRARRIAFVPQILRALPDVRVDTFVGYGRYPHRRLFQRASEHDREAVRRALEEADAADLAERPLAELSGGQRQRALVARALAQEAELLLFDEPTSALDPEHQLRVFELIARLVQQGRCALVATHELNLASQFATRVLLVDEGRLVADGTVDEVLQRAVLEPVYGEHLWYGSLPGAQGDRPIVLPWMRPL